MNIIIRLITNILRHEFNLILSFFNFIMDTRKSMKKTYNIGSDENHHNKMSYWMYPIDGQK